MLLHEVSETYICDVGKKKTKKKVTTNERESKQEKNVKSIDVDSLEFLF